MPDDSKRVGPASPVRPPTSFDTAIRDVENCLRYVVPRDSDKENFEQLRQAVARLQACSPVRDPAPPDEPEHPEAFCQQCRRRNVVWFAPSDIWNATMGGGQGILCPVCFIEAAERAGLFGPWIVAPGHSVQKRSGGERVRGVRDPSPPERDTFKRALDALQFAHGEWARTKWDHPEQDRNRLADAAVAAENEVLALFDAACGVRGAGVVPPARSVSLEACDAALEDMARTVAERNQEVAVLKAALARGVVPSAPRPSLSDEQLLEAFVAGCNAENELNAAELSPQNVRKGIAAAIRRALGGLSSAAAPPDVIALAEKYIASGVLEQSNKMNHPVAVRAFAAWARGELEVGGGVDCGFAAGGVAPAGPWVVERFYTQDKWFVRRGIEIPGEMSQFALHWFRSEAEAEAVCDVLNRVAETRPASSGNTLLNDVVGGSSRSGEALPKP